MSDPITKTVMAFSAMHAKILRIPSAASNPKNFPKAVLTIVLSSTLFGYGLMQIVDRKREANMKMMHVNNENRDNDNIGKNTVPISHNESLVRAMIENAKSLSPRENLENAAMAQKNFMLVQFDKSVAEGNADQKFLEQIAKRSQEIRRNNDDSDDSSD